MSRRGKAKATVAATGVLAVASIVLTPLATVHAAGMQSAVPPQFVAVPKGTFVMGRKGSPSAGARIMDDPNLTLTPGFLSYDEQPPHSVMVDAFEMMPSLVTQELFAT